MARVVAHVVTTSRKDITFLMLRPRAAMPRGRIPKPRECETVRNSRLPQRGVEIGASQLSTLYTVQTLYTVTTLSTLSTMLTIEISALCALYTVWAVHTVSTL